MAEQATSKARTIVERLRDPNLPDELTTRGRALAGAIGDAAETASERAAIAWRDAEPMRRDAAKAGREALRWGRRTWRSDMLPGINRLWNKRTVALGAAGAAIPVAKELIDDAAIRMGIRKRQEERHWGSFFVGLLLGGAAGVIAAILSAPKAGREIRDELAGQAKVAATRAREVASPIAREVAARAREAAANAGDWVPIFQRPMPSEPVDEPVVEVVAEMPAAPEPKPATSRKRSSGGSATGGTGSEIDPIDEVGQPD